MPAGLSLGGHEGYFTLPSPVVLQEVCVLYSHCEFGNKNVNTLRITIQKLWPKTVFYSLARVGGARQRTPNSPRRKKVKNPNLRFLTAMLKLGKDFGNQPLRKNQEKVTHSQLAALTGTLWQNRVSLIVPRHLVENTILWQPEQGRRQFFVELPCLRTKPNHHAYHSKGHF